MWRSRANLLRRLAATQIFNNNNVIATNFSTITSQDASTSSSKWLALAALAAGSGLGLTLSNHSSSPTQCGANKEFTLEDVANHRTKATGIWVTYKDSVYDVTEWVDIHPGGADKLMLAAGGPIDAFWAMYQQHNTDQVKAMLETYRIGKLKAGSALKINTADPYANEPKDRLPALVARSQNPMNAETPLSLLAESFITPTPLFYIRNHLPVPDIDFKTYKLKVEGECGACRSIELSLEDLKTKFPQHTITATVQCTGNRRDEFNKVKKVKGLEWEGGSIGNAEWTGVLLRDVLLSAGLGDGIGKENNSSNSKASPPQGETVSHIQFEGLDNDGAGTFYGASIPISKALDPQGDVLLCFEMNGQPLSRDHGAPLRVLVPGVAGCRSVKWVGKIIPSQVESSSFWQQKDYKTFSPSVDWDTVDWEASPAIQNMPVTSLICSPSPGTEVYVSGGETSVEVKGYAWSGGGNSIIRVDVSADGGKTWQEATLKKTKTKNDDQKSSSIAPGKGWSWVLWEAEIDLPPSLVEHIQKSKGKGQRQEEVVLVCKATDESCNTQPERAGPIWNLRGVNCNSWHSCTVKAM